MRQLTTQRWRVAENDRDDIPPEGENPGYQPGAEGPMISEISGNGEVIFQVNDVDKIRERRNPSSSMDSVLESRLMKEA